MVDVLLHLGVNLAQHGQVLMPGRGLLELLVQRVVREVFLLFGPVEDTPDGGQSATLLRITPRRVSVQPFRDVVFLELRHLERLRFQVVDEILQVLPVPVIGALGVMGLRVVEELVDDRRDRIPGNGCFGVAHQLVELGLGALFGGAEAIPLTSNRHAPFADLRPPPGLRSWPSENPPAIFSG